MRQSNLYTMPRSVCTRHQQYTLKSLKLLNLTQRSERHNWLQVDSGPLTFHMLLKRFAEVCIAYLLHLHYTLTGQHADRVTVLPMMASRQTPLCCQVNSSTRIAYMSQSNASLSCLLDLCKQQWQFSLRSQRMIHTADERRRTCGMVATRYDQD